VSDFFRELLRLFGMEFAILELIVSHKLGSSLKIYLHPRFVDSVEWLADSMFPCVYEYLLPDVIFREAPVCRGCNSSKQRSKPGNLEQPA
jgi:hypothetical protein